MPSTPPVPADRGYIVPIGGAEEKVGDTAILERFLGHCGLGDARIAVIPTASQLSDTGARYERVFRDLGAGDVDVLDVSTRAQAESEDAAHVLEQASGVFMTGGNQLRLSTILGGTRLATAIRRANARGVHVAGTSAGAAYISEHMIAYGGEGATPIAGNVTLCAGLGLTNRIIVDQHFTRRDRLGRLLTALAYNPFAIGVGLDEDTAAAIDADNVIDVVGSGAITVVDVSDLDYSSMASAREGDPVELIGVKLHILSAGAQYHLDERRAVPAGA